MQTFSIKQTNIIGVGYNFASWGRLYNSFYDFFLNYRVILALVFFLDLRKNNTMNVHFTKKCILLWNQFKTGNIKIRFFLLRNCKYQLGSICSPQSFTMLFYASLESSLLLWKSTWRRTAVDNDINSTIYAWSQYDYLMLAMGRKRKKSIKKL